MEEDTTPLEITHEVDLPSDDTSYFCSTHKLPRQFRARKHHTIMVGLIVMANGHFVSRNRPLNEQTIFRFFSEGKNS